MNKSFYFLVGLVLFAPSLIAHGGVGIVRDPLGNVFYTDLVHVWKIDSKGGKTIAIKDVHTHELWVGADGALFGEHLWYEERSDQWMHYVWRLKSGEFNKIRSAKTGFNKDFSFVRDSQGFMYIVNNENKTIERFKEDVPAKREVVAQIEHFVQWLSISEKDEIFFSDGFSIKKILPGNSPVFIVENLSDSNKPWSFNKNKHDIMGMTITKNGKLFVTYAENRKIISVDVNGKITIEYEGGWPWTPTGILVDNNNVLWILEYSSFNQVRVIQYIDGEVLKVF